MWDSTVSGLETYVHVGFSASHLYGNEQLGDLLFKKGSLSVCLT